MKKKIGYGVYKQKYLVHRFFGWSRNWKITVAFLYYKGKLYNFAQKTFFYIEISSFS